MTTTEQWNGKLREMKCTHFWHCPGIHVSWLKTPIKTTITTAGLLYLTLSLPNTKRNCYYTLDRQFRSESIIGQFQILNTLSVKISHHTVPPPSSPGSTAPCGPGPPQFRGFTITVTHTTLGRTPLDEWSARRRNLYLATYNAHRRRTSTRPAGFEPEISARERPQTHARPLGLAFPDTLLIQFPCPRFSQWSLSKWFAHQDTARIYLPIKPTHPALRDMFVLIPLSVLFTLSTAAAIHERRRPMNENEYEALVTWWRGKTASHCHSAHHTCHIKWIQIKPGPLG